MNTRAKRYIKPEKLHEAALPTIQIHPDLLKKNKETKTYVKQDITDVITEQSFIDSDEGDEPNDPSEIPNGRPSNSKQSSNLIIPKLFRQGSEPSFLHPVVPLARKTMSFAPVVKTSNPKRESVQGRQRVSTMDPNSLKLLKNIKVNTLKEDDQIEVSNFVSK